ncbi:DinB family protein [Dinoroseobacter sp. S124A]|uniref:DinB family protein n=1 Tax=Dinoroseobacter sp. S124A TaxID=3415128 RepID=UPI003C7CF573
MITPEFCRTMARYNAWQNGALIAAADGLGEAELVKYRGSFFGSILQTFSHLLWGDTLWMSRFDGWDTPKGGITESVRFVEDWGRLTDLRADADAMIRDWADGLDEAALGGSLSWYSGALKADVTRPLALCVAHFFNHQTHHRGQIHAMLTAAGARPGDTDLFVMPEGI